MLCFLNYKNSLGFFPHQKNKKINSFNFFQEKLTEFQEKRKEQENDPNHLTLSNAPDDSGGRVEAV